MSLTPLEVPRTLAELTPETSNPGLLDLPSPEPISLIVPPSPGS